MNDAIDSVAGNILHSLENPFDIDGNVLSTSLSIAEGIENENMLEPLRMHQCDEVQGYYFARPMPTDEFSLYLSGTREV